MPQNTSPYTAINSNNQPKPMTIGPGGGLIQGGGEYSMLNITSQTLVFAGPGTVVRISISVAGAAGTINDAASISAVAAANLIGAIPATVGYMSVEFPFFNGLVITPGAGQTLAVSFNR